MKNGLLIGICGEKRSGKDTMADYLCNNYAFVKYALADPMKKGVQEMFGFTDKQLWGEDEHKESIDERYGVSPRKVMQKFASELFQFDIYKLLPEIEKKIERRLFWVYRFRAWYKKEMESKIKLNVVVSDVRFPHEADPIKEMNGIIIKVVRNNKNNNLQKDNHMSETEMIEIKEDYLIVNNGTKKDYYKKIDDVIKELRK